MAKATTKTPQSTTLNLPGKLQTVHVTRPKNVVTIVNDVDDIDVRVGSLLLLRRDHNPYPRQQADIALKKIDGGEARKVGLY